MVRAHWTDVEGMSTGFGAGPQARDPWMEGLQLDQLKIYKAGRLNQTLNKLIADNIRYPEASLGDMRSQIVSCRLAMRRLDELLEKFGQGTLLAAIGRIFSESEEKCRNLVNTIPDGVYEVERFFDNDGVVLDEPLRLHARITVDGGHMVIDLSCSAGERDAGYNSRTHAGARVAYKALTAPHEPVNEGSFGALDAIIPEGSIMMARNPRPMTGWGQIIPTVVDTILAALAPAMKDRIPAGHHGLLGGAVAFFGALPGSGARFLLQSLEGGGWGGRPFEDGEHGTVSACQGDVRNASIEGMEMKNPVVVEARELRPDSGGAGKYRGGLGISLRVLNEAEGRWNFLRSGRVDHPPLGVWGGGPGAVARYLLRNPGENDYRPMTAVRHLVPAGSPVVVETGGGGGWGDPKERDPEQVRMDLRQGLITRQAAEREYGVVIKDDG